MTATKQLLTQTDARQHDRDAQLARTLATLAEQKRAIVTPAQILRELQKIVPLPAPITLQPDETTPVGARFSASPLSSPSKSGANQQQQTGPAPANPTNDKSTSVQAVIPTADLKPLYDFTLDGQACQAKLSAAQADLADEKSKTATLTKERDDTLRIAKGGNPWRRITRAAIWFLLGAAAGAIATKTR